MLKISDTISLNRYGQKLIGHEILLSLFSSFELYEKRRYLQEIIALIVQSKPRIEDIDSAIFESKLKTTYTPCVLLKKGVDNHYLNKIAELAEIELDKAFLLLLALFRVAYQRRFEAERNHSHKWWYWDLSDENNIKKIESM